MSDLGAPFDPRRGRWIPWVFVGGMLLVVLVNGGLIFASLSTFTGVTVGQSYDRGLTYNHVVEESRRQQALGWQAQLGLHNELLSVVVVDRAGQPVSGLLDGLLQRPLDGSQVPLSFRQVGAGHFEAAAAPPRPGQWEARLVLHGSGGESFDIRQRLIAP